MVLNDTWLQTKLGTQFVELPLRQQHSSQAMCTVVFYLDVMACVDGCAP
jgi:hypothetical protein